MVALPWQLTAGRYTEVSDVSSAPDGTVYVLDSYQRAVHELAPDGTPRRAFPVPDAADDEWSPRRLDVGFDGKLLLLSDSSSARQGGVFVSRVDTLSATGVLEVRFEVGALTPRAYVDVAARADGRIYVSRSGAGNPYIVWPGPTPTPSTGERPDNAVEVYSAAGAYMESIAPPEMGLPGNLDLAPDGRLYVINRVPVPWGEPPAGPTATPRPSILGRASEEGERPVQQSTAAPTPERPAPIEGVLVFEPSHRYVETVRFQSGEDVAAAPSGAYVSRNVEIFALREGTPMYVGPAGRVVNAFFGRITFNLDFTADGRLLAGMNHCYFQGLLIFADPSARPAVPRMSGANDAPYLEGPPYPVRVAASDEVAVLQGRFEASGTPPTRRYIATNFLFEPQTVQRWTRRGALRGEQPLRSQLGVCAGSDSWWTRDVAIDGRDVYTVDPYLVQLRPDDGLPAWSAAPALIDDPEAPSRLVAAAAHAGRVAVLDAGTGKVHVLDRGGQRLASWSASQGATNSLPVDIAVHGDEAYLGDLGRARLQARSLVDGRLLAEWPTHDGVRAVAAGPDGDIFVLGRGGWGFRYGPRGELEATWPMPDRSLDALDIAVDVDGRVYVAWVDPERSEPSSDGREIFLFQVRNAGIWVFEPAQAGAPPDTPPDACLARPDKRAAPTRLPIGETVEVTLDVDGRCPGAYDPVQVALVLDASRSMNFQDALNRSRDAVAGLLARLDPRAAEVALVTFEEGATLAAQLSRDIATVASLAQARDADGDTRLAPALELARQELTGPRGNASARRIVLLVTDGVFHDEPLAAADALRAEGIEVYLLVVPTYEFNSAHRATVAALAGDPTHVFIDPDALQVAQLADGLVRFRPQRGLFERIEVVDEVPGNMAYIEGSAAPAAIWNPAARTLTWYLGSKAASDVVHLTYRLRPLEIGTWPTNVQATAPYRDVLGHEDTLVFPVPTVTVYGLDHRLYLPFLAKQSCFRKDRPVDIALVMDTSSSMTEEAPSGGTKLDAARAAAASFLDLLQPPTDHVALVAFDVRARREADLTGDVGAVRAALGGLTTTQGTHIDAGLEEARRVLADGARAGARPVVVLLTDGMNNAGPAPVLEAVAGLRSAGALVYAIGLGADVDGDLLRQVATTPDHYHPSPTVEELQAIYHQISEQLACDLR